MDTREDGSGYIYSYLGLRRTVGLMAFFLPVVLVLVQSIIDREFQIFHSLSFYYHTDLQDVFVGTNCAIGLFLFFYRGLDWRDNWTGNIAGFCAIGLSLVPASCDRSLTTAQIFHIAFGSIFFACLAIFSLYLFRLSDKDEAAMTPEKKKRNVVYLASGIVIILGLILVIVDALGGLPSLRGGFTGEVLGLWAFGVAWFVKGETLLADKRPGSWELDPEDGTLFLTVILDPQSEAAVRNMQQSLDRVVNDESEKPRHRPHITLAAYPSTAHREVRRVLAELAEETLSFRLRLRSIGAFPADKTLFLNPVPSGELIDLQRELVGRIKERVLYPQNLSPGLWVPHVTAAAKIPSAGFMSAVESLTHTFLEIEGSAIGIGVLESERGQIRNGEIVDSDQVWFAKA